MKTITVIGAGSWGATLSVLLAQNPLNKVILWDRSGSKIQKIKESGIFPRPKGLTFPKSLELSDNLIHACANSQIWLCAIPSDGVASLIKELKDGLPKPNCILSTTKGLERSQNQTMSQLWEKAFPESSVVVLSGPNLSAEIAQKLPSRTVLAARKPEDSHAIAELFGHNNQALSFDFCSDLHGLELCGAAKNVFALAAGIWDGFKLGTSGKGCLLLTAIEEMQKILLLAKANPQTVFTAGGIADLFITCSSQLSRNYQTGLYLAEGKTLAEISEVLSGQTAEGVSNTPLIMSFAEEHHATLPICTAVQGILGESTLDPERLSYYRQNFAELILRKH